MNNVFQLICSDPPYSFDDALNESSVKRGAEANYSTLTIPEIAALPVKQLADPKGCVLALWIPSSLLLSGLQIMESWGFAQKQLWCWIKIQKDPFKHIKKTNDFDNIDWNEFLSFGMGRLGRNAHEIVLIGTMGKIYQNLKNKSQRTVFFAPNLKHSQKPEILQDKLELMFPKANSLEIFARRQRTNWTCIGNQAPATFNEDIRDSFIDLLNG